MMVLHEFDRSENCYKIRLSAAHAGVELKRDGMGLQRIACLTSRPITRHQFKRVAANDHFRFFDYETEGVSWLDEGVKMAEAQGVAA